MRLFCELLLQKCSTVFNEILCLYVPTAMTFYIEGCPHPSDRRFVQKETLQCFPGRRLWCDKCPRSTTSKSQQSKFRLRFLLFLSQSEVMVAPKSSSCEYCQINQNKQEVVEPWAASCKFSLIITIISLKFIAENREPLLSLAMLWHESRTDFVAWVLKLQTECLMLSELSDTAVGSREKSHMQRQGGRLKNWMKVPCKGESAVMLNWCCVENPAGRVSAMLPAHAFQCEISSDTWICIYPVPDCTIFEILCSSTVLQDTRREHLNPTQWI